MIKVFEIEGVYLIYSHWNVFKCFVIFSGISWIFLYILEKQPFTEVIGLCGLENLHVYDTI